MVKAPKILRESKAQDSSNQQFIEKDDPEVLSRHPQNVPVSSEIREFSRLNSLRLPEAELAWFNDILSTPSLLRTILSRDRTNLYKNLMIRLYNSLKKFPETIGKNNKFFKLVLERFLQNEQIKNPSFDIYLIVHNKAFITSLIALTIEIYMLIHDDTSIQFKDLLQRMKVKPLDFWKHIGNFGSLFPDIPRVLRIHLKEIEAKILMNLIWKDKYLREKNVFFNRLISLIAHRTYVFCHHLGFPQDACEYIWSSVTYFLAQKSSILKEKSIDCVIIYTVFIFFKVYAQIPFAELTKRYNNIFFLKSELNSNSKEEVYDREFENEILNTVLNRQTEIKAAFPEFIIDEKLETRAKKFIVKEKVGFVADRTKQLWKTIN